MADSTLLHQLEGIDRRSLEQDFEVKVRGGGPARRPGERDHLVLPSDLSST